MIFHSSVFDGFFTYPKDVRNDCDRIPMTDHKASDGVTYPGIIQLPDYVTELVHLKIRDLYKSAKPRLTFGRYSLDYMTPPNWAHSDGNMAQMLALIYLSDSELDSGTFIVKHKEHNFFRHPRTEIQKRILLADSNDQDKWQEVHYCRSEFNRLFVLSADLIHAAGPGFGSTQAEGRFVISCFFDLERENDQV